MVWAIRENSKANKSTVPEALKKQYLDLQDAVFKKVKLHDELKGISGLNNPASAYTMIKDFPGAASLGGLKDKRWFIEKKLGFKARYEVVDNYTQEQLEDYIKDLEGLSGGLDAMNEGLREAMEAKASAKRAEEARAALEQEAAQRALAEKAKAPATAATVADLFDDNGGDDLFGTSGGAAAAPAPTAPTASADLTTVPAPTAPTASADLTTVPAPTVAPVEFGPNPMPAGYVSPAPEVPVLPANLGTAKASDALDLIRKAKAANAVKAEEAAILAPAVVTAPTEVAEARVPQVPVPAPVLEEASPAEEAALVSIPTISVSEHVDEDVPEASEVAAPVLEEVLLGIEREVIEVSVSAELEVPEEDALLEVPALLAQPEAIEVTTIEVPAAASPAPAARMAEVLPNSVTAYTPPASSSDDDEGDTIAVSTASIQVSLAASAPAARGYKIVSKKITICVNSDPDHREGFDVNNRSSKWHDYFKDSEVDFSKPQSLKVNGIEVSENISPNKNPNPIYRKDTQFGLDMVSSLISRAIAGQCKVQCKKNSDKKTDKTVVLEIESCEELTIELPDENPMFLPEMVSYVDADANVVQLVGADADLA